MDAVALGLLVLVVFLLFGAGLFGVPYGIYRAWPKASQPKWNWKPALLISVPSALVVYVGLPLLGFIVASWR